MAAHCIRKQQQNKQGPLSIYRAASMSSVSWVLIMKDIFLRDTYGKQLHAQMRMIATYLKYSSPASTSIRRFEQSTRTAATK